MKLSDGSARGIGAVVGLVAFIVAMNVYLVAPVHHSFRTGWIPYVLAWVIYRLAWARLSVLQRCPSGCGARIYYRLESCPQCLAPLSGRNETAPGPRAFHDELRAAKLARTEHG
jgi:hypothetical protein